MFDLFPLLNSLRIALLSSVIVVFSGIFISYKISNCSALVKSIFDVVFTLPLVLPPTVIGYFLILIFGLNAPIGSFLSKIGVKFVMTWYGGIISSAVVSFPLMYRASRASFEAFNEELAESALILGKSKSSIFWKIRVPNCKEGILAGGVLSFARALGEYGATSMLIGYTPNKTATISTTVYNLWRINNNRMAFIWIIINIVLSALVLITVNIIEKKYGSYKS